MMDESDAIKLFGPPRQPTRTQNSWLFRFLSVLLHVSCVHVFLFLLILACMCSWTTCLPLFLWLLLSRYIHIFMYMLLLSWCPSLRVLPSGASVRTILLMCLHVQILMKFIDLFHMSELCVTALSKLPVGYIASVNAVKAETKRQTYSPSKVRLLTTVRSYNTTIHTVVILPWQSESEGITKYYIRRYCNSWVRR